MEYEAIHVNDILDKWNTKDAAISEYADSHDCIIITKDADFRDSMSNLKIVQVVVIQGHLKDNGYQADPENKKKIKEKRELTPQEEQFREFDKEMALVCLDVQKLDNVLDYYFEYYA